MNGQPSTVIPRWQGAIAALSLVVLTTVVLLPLATLLLGLWGGILGVASAWLLNAVGVQGDRLLKDSVSIALALLGSAGSIALAGAAASGIRKLRAKPAPRPAAYPYGAPPVVPPNPSKPWSSRVFEHPWLTLGGVALFVDGCVVPFHASNAIRLPPELLGGFILTGATLLFMFAVAFSFRAFVYWMRTLWSGIRQSGFFAGLVTAASLVASAVVLLIGHAFGQVASALNVPETTRQLEACSGSTDCSRRVLQSALDGQPRQSPSLPVGAYSPERRAGFDQCVEELRTPESRGWSTIDWALFEANSIIGDKATAEDLVHSTILTVCLMPERIHAIKPYFIKSVKNAARTQWRKNRQTCPVVVGEPTWFVDQCIAASVEQQAIQIETETAANLALCALSHDDRRLIVWHVQQGFSHAQIAKRLDISEDAARKRYSRALDELRREFAQRCR